mmetsp:Transcript_17465/g.27905  ORF Transcript_17465/g.27905 Transcript_17465/m.27905 type:complete len:364 (+) Transcript_17465:63-1154(+)
MERGSHPAEHQPSISGHIRIPNLIISQSEEYDTSASFYAKAFRPINNSPRSKPNLGGVCALGFQESSSLEKANWAWEKRQKKRELKRGKSSPGARFSFTNKTGTTKTINSVEEKTQSSNDEQTSKIMPQKRNSTKPFSPDMFLKFHNEKNNLNVTENANPFCESLNSSFDHFEDSSSSFSRSTGSCYSARSGCSTPCATSSTRQQSTGSRASLERKGGLSDKAKYCILLILRVESDDTVLQKNPLSGKEISRILNSVFLLPEPKKDRVRSYIKSRNIPASRSHRDSIGRNEYYKDKKKIEIIQERIMHSMESLENKVRMWLNESFLASSGKTSATNWKNYWKNLISCTIKQKKHFAAVAQFLE